MSAVLPTAPPATEFRDARAVETWDAQFRWRQDGVLRDITVDDTWTRVAQALNPDAMCADAYRNAFARWRLLPDAWLLRHAGTGAMPAPPDPFAVVLNMQAFVARRGVFDFAAFAATAELARRLCDDARTRFAAGAPLRAAIGLIGFDAAREALGLPAGSRETREFAARLAIVLATHAGRDKVRLTAQPLLAQFANHVGDGFDGPARDTLLDTVQPWLRAAD